MLLLAAPVALAGFGLHDVSVALTNKDGSPAVQAGSHPYQLTMAFTTNGPEVGAVLEEPSELFAEADVKDARVQLPPGLLANPSATARCAPQQFAKGAHSCPDGTAVGVATIYTRTNESGLVGVGFASDPVYNVEPPPGVAAQFAFKVNGSVPVFMDASLRTGGDYGVTLDTRNITEIEPVYQVKVRIWGVPADPGHDPLRGACVPESSEGEPGESNSSCPTSGLQRALLRNPTSCGTPLVASISVDSWQQPGSFLAPFEFPMPPITGCETLDFHPTVALAPEETAASTPTGVRLHLGLSQESASDPAALAPPDLRTATVVLPVGMQISPAAANGLLACSPQQFALHSAAPASCPEASKVANVRIDTPLLPEPLTGSAYLAQQGNLPGNGENPFGSLTAVYVLVEGRQAGIIVKLAGEVAPDPITGQLAISFRAMPQLPLSDLELSFFGGPRGLLSTPAACGAYATEASIEPWSGAEAASLASRFEIGSGPAGGPCPSPQPFAPAFQAGTTNIRAGAFTPFTLDVSRHDDDQPLGAIRATLPPGLLATLPSVKPCREPQALAGSCAPESLIGETTISAGLGIDPITLTGGKVYVTGPYEGAPFGLSIAIPAVAGPFNLGPGGGPVVIRARLEVDPNTAALTLTTDPLPSIEDGVPLQLQRLDLTISRPGFLLNPTNCSPLSVTGMITSNAGAKAAGASRFQVGDCATLPFKPKLTALTRANGEFTGHGASLHVLVAIPAGHADMRSLKVDLPQRLPARLRTIQHACPQRIFIASPATCPKQSMVGSATVQTPILATPMSGPAYLVSHGGAAFPDIVLVLQAQGVRIDLTGALYVDRHNVSSTTFRAIPDVPIRRLDLILPEGRSSLLAASAGLCAKQPLIISYVINAQDNARVKHAVRVPVEGCKTPMRNRHKRHSTHPNRRQ